MSGEFPVISVDSDREPLLSQLNPMHLSHPIYLRSIIILSWHKFQLNHGCYQECSSGWGRNLAYKLKFKLFTAIFTELHRVFNIEQ